MGFSHPPEHIAGALIEMKDNADYFTIVTIIVGDGVHIRPGSDLSDRRTAAPLSNWCRRL